MLRKYFVILGCLTCITAIGAQEKIGLRDQQLALWSAFAHRAELDFSEFGKNEGTKKISLWLIVNLKGDMELLESKDSPDWLREIILRSYQTLRFHSVWEMFWVDVGRLRKACLNILKLKNISSRNRYLAHHTIIGCDSHRFVSMKKFGRYKCLISPGFQNRMEAESDIKVKAALKRWWTLAKSGKQKESEKLFNIFLPIKCFGALDWSASQIRLGKIFPNKSKVGPLLAFKNIALRRTRSIVTLMGMAKDENINFSLNFKSVEKLDRVKFLAFLNRQVTRKKEDYSKSFKACLLGILMDSKATASLRYHAAGVLIRSHSAIDEIFKLAVNCNDIDLKSDLIFYLYTFALVVKDYPVIKRLFAQYKRLDNRTVETRVFLLFALEPLADPSKSRDANDKHHRSFLNSKLKDDSLQIKILAMQELGRSPLGMDK